MGLDSVLSSENLHIKTQLRKQLRARRRALSDKQQSQAGRDIAEHISSLSCYKNANNIAVYLPSDGEISTQALIDLARSNGKRCYLPKLRGKQMDFVAFDPSDTLIPNQYGIPEPSSYENTIVPSTLDIVLMPLVGFDDSGKRLGMGGGYYDRCFEFKNRPYSKGPILIGMAHQCQATAHVPNDTWDIPLDIIVTDLSVAYTLE